MTDLTILIAVIALALWPIVFLISRILHERNKRAKPSGDTASAETEEVTEEMTTSALIMSILQQLGCQPEVNEENHISFKYQGDDFLVAAEDGLRLIIVWNPWWASISIDNLCSSLTWSELAAIHVTLLPLSRTYISMFTRSNHRTCTAVQDTGGNVTCTMASSALNVTESLV